MVIVQRVVEIGDAELLLSWRNDPKVRALSFREALILKGEHYDWLSARILRASNEPYNLYLVDGQPIGMTRLDLISEEKNVFEISIIVEPNIQGKGFGKEILNLACQEFFKDHPLGRIIARVQKENVASNQLFLGSEFQLQNSESDVNIYERFK